MTVFPLRSDLPSWDQEPWRRGERDGDDASGQDKALGWPLTLGTLDVGGTIGARAFLATG